MVQAPLFFSEFIVPKFKKIESREVFFCYFMVFLCEFTNLEIIDFKSFKFLFK